MESEALSTYGRVKALFEEVCDLPAGEREAKLARCGEEPAVVAEVRALLEHETDGHAHFAQPVVAAIGRLASDQLREGDILEAWKLEKEIGHGGMGKVFRARRADGHFEQVAAVKLLRGVPTANALEYLARERQILAQLSHPNIARLLDGGATPGGQPYLVMDYIEGVPIDRHCIDQALPVAAILKLFAAICDAVSFAHGQLVVHCDLKPTNILVDRSGRPMLLDFGIARMLGGGILEAPTGSSDSPAYTPRYASPEQRAGQAVSTASDVFSLGVMLGELITERGPAELRAAVAKATHPDPAQRYASAHAMAVDLEHYVQRFPLAAMEPTLAYRARKLAQRRWPWLVAGAAFIFTFSAFTMRLVAERDRAKSAEQETAIERDRALGAERSRAAERDRAVAAEVDAVAGRDRARAAERLAVTERERAMASEAGAAQLNRFLLSVFEDDELADLGSPDVPALRLVDSAHARIEKELKGQPQTQVAIYQAMGTVYRNLGQTQAAVADFQRAVELERTLNRPLELARLLSTVAYIRAGWSESAFAEKDAREALALRLRHAGPDSPQALDSYQTLGRALTGSAQFTESTQLLEKAVALATRLHGEDSLEVSEALILLGNRYRARASHRAKGSQLLERSLEIRRARVGDGHRLTIATLQRIAQLHRDSGRLVESEAAYRKALAQRLALHGPRGNHVRSARQGLGLTLLQANKPLEAIEQFQLALVLDESERGRPTAFLASLHGNLASACLLAGNDPCAEQAYREALSARTRTAPVTDAEATGQYRLGRFLLRRGHIEEAGPLLNAAHETYLKVHGAPSTEVLEVLTLQAYRDAWRGRHAVAERSLAGLTAQATRLGGGSLREFLRYRGLARAEAGRFDEALADLHRSEQGRLLEHGDDDLLGWHVALDRAEVLWSAGRREEAASLAHVLQLTLGKSLVPDSVIHPQLRRMIER